MHSFAASDLQRNSAEIQKAALMGPVFLTYHDKPRYVMMSLDEFARMQGKDVTARLATYPKAVAARVREIANARSGIETVREPSAIAVDKLVLATVNAPYKRAIDAVTLQASLTKLDFDQWPVHIATFFTDVTPELVFKFADRHRISRSKLAEAYLAIRKKTGERNPDLEAELVSMASPSQSNTRRLESASKKRKSGS
jgi:PHD/YefM family antitoxin component YafN of YafNO toxin-antitoxin module